MPLLDVLTIARDRPPRRGSSFPFSVCGFLSRMISIVNVGLILEAVERTPDVGRLLDGRAVDRRDHVACLHAGLGSRRTVRHRSHEDAVLHAEVLAEPVGEIFERDAEPAAARAIAEAELAEAVEKRLRRPGWNAAPWALRVASAARAA